MEEPVPARPKAYRWWRGANVALSMVAVPTSLLGLWFMLLGSSPVSACTDVETCGPEPITFLVTGAAMFLGSLVIPGVLWGAFAYWWMHMQFTAPPGWPASPLGWVPMDYWAPPSYWPSPPTGWSYWRRSKQRVR
jgi:hypothetical protein